LWVGINRNSVRVAVATLVDAEDSLQKPDQPREVPLEEDEELAVTG